jgi:5-methylthioadenosine/S-adenosylhomocysteine deaminase
MFKHQVVRAVSDSKMRAVLARGLVGSCQDGVLEDGDRMREALEDIAYYKENFKGGLLSFFLAPHAIYTCDSGYLRHVIRTAGAQGLGIHIHAAESTREFDDSLTNNHMTPIAYLDSLGMFHTHTVAAHCVYVTEEDIDILAKNNVHVVTNPISNMKLGNGFAPVPKLLSAGVNVALGTDSAASNNSLNLFRDLSALTLIHKGESKDPTAVSAKEGFLMATLRGAKALGLASATGSIEVGKAADLVVLNLDTPNFYPRNNLISALSYSATGKEVETVIIGGEIVMDKNGFKTIDAERVYYEIAQISEKLFT